MLVIFTSHSLVDQVIYHTEWTLFSIDEKDELLGYSPPPKVV